MTETDFEKWLEDNKINLNIGGKMFIKNLKDAGFIVQSQGEINKENEDMLYSFWDRVYGLDEMKRRVVEEFLEEWKSKRGDK